MNLIYFCASNTKSRRNAWMWNNAETFQTFWSCSYL